MRAARHGNLHKLTKLAPVAIIAETLGYSPTTTERHAVDSSAAYARYMAAVPRGLTRRQEGSIQKHASGTRKL